MFKSNNTSKDSASLTKEIDTYLQAHLNNNHFMGSVLVSRGEEVLLSKGYGMANLEHSVSNTPSTKFRLASVTKQFTATAILKLQEQNLLDVNDSLATYLPKYPKGKRITIHQLLSHTSGIPNFTGFEDFQTKKRMRMELDELIAWFKDRPLEFTPGKRQVYSNSGYVLLTKIIETVSNHSYADYLQQHFFKLLEMTNSGYDCPQTILPHRAAGYLFNGEVYKNVDFIDMSIPSGAGGLYSTTEDLYKWSQALDTDAILTQASKDVMFAPKFEKPIGTNKHMYYCYGWITDIQRGRAAPRFQRDRQFIFLDGGVHGFRTHFSRYPDDKVRIIVLSNLETASHFKIKQDLAAIVFGEAYKLPKKRKAIALDPAILEKYVGQYKFAPNPSLFPETSKLVFTVTTDSQRIFVQFRQEKYEFFPESPTEFFFKVADIQLTFIDRDDGKLQVIYHRYGKDLILNKI